MVSDRQLAVYLDGDLCGRISQSASGNLAFSYDPEYRVRSGATPLSLSMPLAVTVGRQFGVAADAAAQVVDDTRCGLITAFESAHASVELRDTTAREVADSVLRGVRRLPLAGRIRG
jgi:hypothetical protein